MPLKVEKKVLARESFEVINISKFRISGSLLELLNFVERCMVVQIFVLDVEIICYKFYNCYLDFVSTKLDCLQ